MIEIFTPSEMKMIDEFAIRTIGVPSLQLMENAGKACVEELMRLIPAQKKRVIIFCGKGNNGGDGFVIARLLALHGWSVIVVLLGQASTFTPDALHCFHQLRETTVAVYSFRQFQSQNDHSFDIIIDAIFGTSFRGSVRGKYREAVR
ncbi:MAG: NAD(P)H-hydrate epimerase, partial [Bacteroidota bacterium]